MDRRSNYEADRSAQNDRDALNRKLDLGNAIQKSLQDQLAKNAAQQQAMSNQFYQMQGQLSAYGNMLGTVGRDSSSSVSGLNGIAEGLKTMIAEKNQEVKLSNKQLFDRTMALANRMRQLQAEWDIKDRQAMETFGQREPSGQDTYRRTEQQVRAQAEFTYRTTMEGEARFLRDAILEKLPPQPKLAPMEEGTVMMFENGGLAGADPLYSFATYLERLARKLSQ